MTRFLIKFDKEFGPKLGIREPTFRAVFRKMEELQSHHIVETGSIRKINNWEGDGQSSIMWHEYSKINDFVTFITIDKDEEAVELVQSLGIPAIQGDSVEILKAHQNHIDVLYLDSFDVNMNYPHEAAMHCIMELTAAMPRLHRNSIVFVDDSPMTPELKITGKGLYVAQFMEKIGAHPFTFGYQAAWLMP